MTDYAIGDIQGCFDELMQLLEQLQFSSRDNLWVAGDLVNRGPKSLETLRFLKQLGPRAKIVLGNHDLHLLAIHYDTTSPRRSDTFAEILAAPDRDELMDWLRHQPLLIHDEVLGYTMVHAGIPPHWSLKKALRCSAEVEQVLQSTLAIEFFRNMYGNKPDKWKKGIQGWERLRMITNYFTRMRFCNAKGKLDFSAKGALSSQPEGFLPWFEHPGKAIDKHKIIFGHWAALEGEADHHNVFALDTGCVWGNTLTAMRLHDQQLFCVPSLKQQEK